MALLSTAAAFALLAADASTGAEPTISQAAIGGARLGLTPAAYRAIFGKPVRVDRLEDGYTRLTFRKSAVEVYFRTGANAGIAVNTYGRSFKMASGVGPCSPASELKRAYGTKLKRLSQNGSVTLYRLGNLVVRVFRTRVTAITLGEAPLATRVAGNSTDCT